MTPPVRVLCAFAVLLAASRVEAEVLPTPGLVDPHIQSVTYDPQNVVGLSIMSGFAVTVIFSPDERIETVTIGDSQSWQVQVNHRADRIAIKPVGSPRPTNMTVMSDQRMYNFTLYGSSLGGSVQAYTISFTYPAPPSAPVPTLRASGTYKLHGDRSLRPVSITDDGESTWVRWADTVPIPAIYRADEQGHRALVNGVMRDGTYVVQGVYGRLVFVAGSRTVVAVRVRQRNGG